MSVVSCVFEHSLSDIWWRRWFLTRDPIRAFLSFDTLEIFCLASAYLDVPYLPLLSFLNFSALFSKKDHFLDTDGHTQSPSEHSQTDSEGGENVLLPAAGENNQEKPTIDEAVLKNIENLDFGGGAVEQASGAKNYGTNFCWFLSRLWCALSTVVVCE